ncbi:MAG: ThuA domain-containing protein [Planctomycetota bacterium]
MTRPSTLAFIIFVLAWTSAASAVETTKATKILLIGKKPDHPFGTHMYLHTCRVLEKALELTKGVDAIVSDGWPKDPAVLKGVKTIVLYTNPGAEFLLQGKHSREFERLMNSGVGIVTIHWASSVFQQNLKGIGQRWIKYLGGTWVSNVGLSTGKSQLKQLIPKHPVCRGWKEYELHDEYYLNPTLREAKALLRVNTKGQDVVVAWVHERKDGGRAFATTLGHFYRNFQIEAFRKMIVNGILWSAHVELPKDGAKVALKPKDLALPKKPKTK